ncbi:MAG: Sec-independent protein translocase subunit TatA/TatB, partial [Thermoplasmata archaeon]
LYGSSQIPKLAHNLGRSMGEFKRGRIEVDKEIRTQQSSDAAVAPAASATPGVPGSSH